jgi:hypothetical protein
MEHQRGWKNILYRQFGNACVRGLRIRLEDLQFPDSLAKLYQ